MNNEEIKAMIKDCVYSEDGITYISDKQYNNYINIIKQLQQENKQLQQENKQLKDNWNKIEQIIENERMSHWAPSPLFLTELLSKMQELEKGGINE